MHARTVDQTPLFMVLPLPLSCFLVEIFDEDPAPAITVI